MEWNYINFSIENNWLEPFVDDEDEYESFDCEVCKREEQFSHPDTLSFERKNGEEVFFCCERCKQKYLFVECVNCSVCNDKVHFEDLVNSDCDDKFLFCSKECNENFGSVRLQFSLQ